MTVKKMISRMLSAVEETITAKLWTYYIIKQINLSFQKVYQKQDQKNDSLIFNIDKILKLKFPYQTMFRMSFFWRSKLLPQTNKIFTRTKLLKPVVLLTGSMLGLSLLKQIENYTDKDKQKNQQGPVLLVDASKYIEPKFKMRDPKTRRSWKQRIAEFFRILELLIIFFPTLILLPLRLFKLTEDIWFNVFVKSIEMAGVVWIKAFQYLSHRRDIIGAKMAQKFMHLREKSPAHPFSATQATFLKEFGKPINEIFDSFNRIPVGVGSIGQVYEAVYQGTRVAVKVRHPKVEKDIERDIDIIFFFSNMMSKISSFFQIPITNYSLKQTLINQIDFNVEAQNLMKFKSQYKDNPDIHFPTPIMSRQAILVEDFVDGTAITNCENRESPFNKQLARVGATVFFQMLMVHNFIHADLHGGNIIVKFKDYELTTWEWVKDRMYIIRRWFETKYLENFETNDIVKELYLENKKEEDEVRAIQSIEGKKVDITLIDVGMTLKMGPVEQQKFITFIKSIIEKKPKICAKMIYNLSMYKGKMISTYESQESFSKYYETLLKLFTELTQIKLKDLQGLTLLKGMLDIIREYGMSLEGEFATLLTNILILEQVGKNLNPEINILKCAVPYFKDTILK